MSVKMAGLKHALMVSGASLRVFLGMVSMEDRERGHLGVEYVLLQVTSDEEIYIEPPEGLVG